MPTDPVNPPARPLRVLIIEDYEEDALLLQRHLAKGAFRVEAKRIETAEALEAALADPRGWDLVIADYTLPGFGAREALEMIQGHGMDVPFIIVSGTIDEVSAVSAMRAGAHDYVLKGHLERLIPAIERELQDAERRRERLRTEREFHLLQRRFSATFNQAAVGMAHTNADGRFLLVNQRLSELLGLPVERLLSLTLRDFILPSERDADKDAYALLLTGKSSGYRAERSLLRSDGSIFPAQFTVSMLQDEAGEGPESHEVHAGASILWVVEDISARKAAERETSELMQRLINSERLAAAGRMANTLAHEINNPLEALTNIFYLLENEALTTQGQELISIAARELDRVGHITRSTLSFYRKVPGRTLDLHTLLEEVRQLFQSRATQHHVEIESDYGHGIELAHYDPALRQVFANLVGNALEAMESTGGRIMIRARLRAGHTIVTVSDTGHGIDATNLRTVFEPFFTTKGERGTGLGLWVTRGIVEEQGGALHLRSCTHGRRRGTTIRISLPAAAVAEPAALVN